VQQFLGDLVRRDDIDPPVEEGEDDGLGAKDGRCVGAGEIREGGEEDVWVEVLGDLGGDEEGGGRGGGEIAFNSMITDANEPVENAARERYDGLRER